MNDPDSMLVVGALGLVLLAMLVNMVAKGMGVNGRAWLRQKLASLRVQRLVLWAAVFAVLTAFAWLVWPTPYRYDHVGVGSGVSYPVRTHRVTGKSEILYPDRGWIPVPEEH